jgi:hypothetical protein
LATFIPTPLHASGVIWEKRDARARERDRSLPFFPQDPRKGGQDATQDNCQRSSGIPKEAVTLSEGRSNRRRRVSGSEEGRPDDYRGDIRSGRPKRREVQGPVGRGQSALFRQMQGRVALVSLGIVTLRQLGSLPLPLWPTARRTDTEFLTLLQRGENGRQRLSGSRWRKGGGAER